jgi:glycosyltransferase involved in cell wall biosynthesis
METFRNAMWNKGSWETSASIIYDAEAIFSFREAEQRRLAGEEVGQDEVARLLSAEMGLTEGVHAVFSVTDKERDYFRGAGVAMAWTLGHTIPPNPTPRGFRERSNLLFVGAMSGLPNRDAVLWFAREIWPRFRSSIDGEVYFQVIGTQPPAGLEGIPGVEALGPVPDLAPLYDRSRIFVAPSRLAAGIPIKVQTAAANGLPVVCTPILAEELGWQHEVELLVADDPQDFAKSCARLYSDEGLWQRLRKNAFERVARECSHEVFADTLAQALGLD